MTDIYVETAWAQMNKRDEELCGDTVQTTSTDDSVIAILSDGLGSGVKASILSTLTASIASGMFSAGATLEETMETIGSTLPICSERGIAYSTLCALQVDKSGHAFVTEFDVPPVIMFRDGSPVELERTTRTVGKRGLEVKEAHFSVQFGDYIIAVSDGVIHAGIGGRLRLGLGMDGLADYLQENLRRGQCAREVAAGIIDYCSHLYDGKAGDDTTALVLRMRHLRRSVFAIGPPRDRSRDAAMARRLARFSGYRGVCGGTTSKMVARELGRTLRVNIDDASPNQPPTGEIEGIDEVTEGIMTLTEVMEILEDGSTGEASETSEQIARRLLESDYVEFLVGRAINAAHQNPDLPFDLTLKQQIVNRIASGLHDRGKRVEIRYY